MDRTLVLQCPKKSLAAFLEAQFARESLKLWDKYYLKGGGLTNDLGFSGNLIRLMPQVTEEVFFFCPEDHKPTKVDVKACKRAFDEVVANPDIGMLRLFRFDHYPLEDDTKFISRLVPYKKMLYIALGGMSIWRKDYFEGFLNEGDTAKEFERKGTEKAIGDGRVYGTNTSIYQHFNLLINGKRAPQTSVKDFK